jgi:hypothetical protein
MEVIFTERAKRDWDKLDNKIKEVGIVRFKFEVVRIWIKK